MHHIPVRTPQEIGLLLRDGRKRAKLDQAELAARLGVSRKWVIEAERGNPGAALGTVLRALDAVGIRLTAPLPEGGTESRGSAPPDVDIDAIVEAARKPRR